MIFSSKVLARYLSCFVVAFFCLTGLFAQHKAGFGTATKPNTIVYKLKSTTSGSSTSRIGESDAALQKALQKLKPKQHQQKFPELAVPSNARISGPASDLALIYELEYDASLPFEQVKRELMATGNIAYVEPLYQREPFHQPNDPRADSTKTTSYDQYYLKLIQAYSGWEAEKGDASIVVGVLDTGFLLTHEEVQDKFVQNTADPIDGIDNDRDGYKDNLNGWDFADRDNDVTDNTASKGHGMGVAGVAAAGTNNGIGMAGVGYNIKFMPLKVFPSTKTGSFGGYEAILYAANKGCKVINLSWGGEFFSQFEQDIINYVVLEKDVVIIAAAGNTNRKVDMYPASYENVISVGGTNQQDLKVPEHTYSYKIDVTAPSKDIYTAHATHNKGYNLTSGTSFGSPMVAASAALVRSKYPALNALQVMERIRATTDNIYHLPGNAPYYGLLGKGRLNLKRALKETDVKSVRCISFKTENERPLQSGKTTQIFAAFTNYLSPVQNLQVTLSSPSPYVTIADESFSAGSIATAGTAHNTQRPYKITVSPDAPAHTIIPFRLDYSDGTYSDFQYFELIINPEFVTLTTDNLKLTFNGKGNIGYNGLNFTQGVGLTYKSNTSLLYEGGLLLATAADRVSDNLHNAAWAPDDNFTSVSPAKVNYNTALADQDLRGALKDKYPYNGNAGVEVKYKAYTWNTPGNQSFVVVEYQIKNVTTATIPKLHTGLFADWDIGTYYENGADWDAERKLGYAYNKVENLPYTGISLLSDETPSYYAIDGSNLNIEDGFTDAEKFTALSSGIENAKAGASAQGSNIAHLVGAVTRDLVPGETKTIAFAILAGDNLEELKKNADAALQRYRSIKSGPAPVAYTTTVCAGSAATWTPEGGNNFRFYADANKTQVLGTGKAWELNNITAKQTLYATNIDSLYESAVGSAVFAIPTAPEVDFVFNSTPIYPGIPVLFTNQSRNSANFKWQLSEYEVQAGENATYTFTKPGTYNITLTASDVLNCSTSTVTKAITVLPASPEVLAQQLSFYPNPSSKSMTVEFLPDVASGKLPSITLTDLTGRQIKPKLDVKDVMHAEMSLEGLPAGMYYVQVMYSHITFTKRIVVL